MRSVALLLVFALGAVACGPSDPPPKPLGKSTVPANRPTTAEALSTAVLASMKANDPQAAVDLLVTVFDIGRVCPKMNPKFLSHRDQLVADTKAAFAECMGLADWSAPKLVSSKGGDAYTGSNYCEGAQPLNDIHLVVQTGGKTIEVLIDDPLSINGAVLMGERPKCKLADAP